MVTTRAAAARNFCIDCVIKHIGQAAALMVEAEDGYPHHRGFAIGHLAEAEAEARERAFDFSRKIRKMRLVVSKFGDYTENGGFDGLMREAFSIAGYAITQDEHSNKHFDDTFIEPEPTKPMR